MKAAALHYGEHPSRVSARLREGWTLEQALKIAFRARRHRGGRNVTWKGVTYASLKELGAAVGVAPHNLVARLGRGASLADAISGKAAPRRGNPKPVTFRGKTYASGRQLGEKYGVAWSVAVRRVGRRWTLAQALGIDDPPPRFRDSSGRPRRTHWVRTEKVAGRDVPLASADDYKLYVITNGANGKQYVGITTDTLGDRLRQHVATARKGRHNKLSHAIRKYGPGAFRIRLIRNDARNFVELEEQEVAEIARRDTIRSGYNSATGGSLSTSKAITVAGRFFASRNAAAAAFGVPVGVFNIRLNRLGWTPEQAAGLERPMYGCLKLTVRGHAFPSLKSAAAAHGISYGVAHSRWARGWTLAQCVGAEPPPDTMRYQGVEIRVGRRRFASYAECARHFGIKSESFRKLVVNDKMAPKHAVEYLRNLAAGRVTKRYKGRVARVPAARR